jgi:hypothetical protein
LPPRHGEGDVKGREAIVKVIAGMPGKQAVSPNFLYT